MKKILMTLLLGSFVVSGMALAPQMALSENNTERGVISVNTEESTELSPNLAEISFMVKTTDVKSLQKASTDNKRIVEAVMAELNMLINKANKDYIKTANYNASPIYIYKDSKKLLDRYEVSNRVIVHTKSIDNIGKMIDKATAAGATNVDSLNFSVENTQSECDALIVKATKSARQRANMIAGALDTTVAGVKSIDYSCNTGSYSTPRYYMAKTMLAANSMDSAEESSTPISAGAIKIRANVNAAFYLK